MTTMHKVYNFINSNGIPEGVTTILGTTYRFTRINDLRYSERPAYRGWTNPTFGTWIIQPEKGTYVKVELI